MTKSPRILFALVILCLLSGSAQAVLEIEITQGVEGALPIAILPFSGQAGPLGDGDTIDGIVESDLKRSGRFAPLSPTAFPEQVPAGGAVDFDLWGGKGVEYLVTGAVSSQGADGATVSFELFDVYDGRRLAGYSVPATQATMRKAAHRISDKIYEALLGERGAFSSRIAYIISNRGGRDQVVYRLEVSDSDGYDPRSVFTSSKPLMSPAWSPDGKSLAYVSFENDRPEVFVQNLATGQRDKLSGRAGINSAPAWSPDGRRLAMTLSGGRAPDVYIMDINSGGLTRITQGTGNNTGPVWMPDGQSIVFTSDRSGRPQLYQVSAKGGKAKRLTFEGRYNAAADVSPDGGKVAMVHEDSNGDRIALQDLRSGEFLVLTDGRLDESPSFAPNGSMVLYATENRGRGVLAAVSVDGKVRQILRQHNEDVREPVWSPFTD